MSEPFQTVIVRCGSHTLFIFLRAMRKKIRKESDVQADIIDEIKLRLPGCIVMKNDPNYIQGIPDLTVLYKDKWAALEVKKSATASHQPNQDFYVKYMNNMSYASFIYPENQEEVLDELQRTLEPPRKTRVPRSKQVSLAKLRS